MSEKLSDPEAYARLEKAVEQQKIKDAQAEKSRQERLKKTEPKAISETISEVMPEIEAAMLRAQKLAEDFRRDIENQCGTLPTRYCPKHETEITPIDLSRTIEDSKFARKFVPRYAQCPICHHAVLVNERHGAWIRMGVPEKVAHATFDNFETTQKGQPEALEAAKTQFLRNAGFLLLVGKHGNGKSHLAASVLKRVGQGIFVTHEELVGQLRQTYESGGREKMMMKYQKTPCLVLDEMIPKMKGDDIEPMLYRILSYRFDRDLITVLTTNEDLASLLSIVGPKLEDRMAQNYTVASFTWQSYRRLHREV